MENRAKLIEVLSSLDNGSGVFSRIQVLIAAKDAGIPSPKWFFTERKIGRNQYALNMEGVALVASAPAPVIIKRKPIITVAPAPEAG